MICRTIIVDRSFLAVNMYKLLLRPFVTTFLVAKRYEEARPWFFRREKIDIAFFNTNTFGRKFDDYYAHFVADEPLQKIPKVFLCCERDRDLQSKLKKLPNSTVVMRPFHPDAFMKLVKDLLEGSR